MTALCEREIGAYTPILQIAEKEQMFVQGLTDNWRDLKPNLSDAKTVSTERCRFHRWKLY